MTDGQGAIMVIAISAIITGIITVYAKRYVNRKKGQNNTQPIKEIEELKADIKKIETGINDLIETDDERLRRRKEERDNKELAQIATARQEMIEHHKEVMPKIEKQHAINIKEYEREDMQEMFADIFTITESGFLIFDDAKLLIKGIEKVSCYRNGSIPTIQEGVVSDIIRHVNMRAIFIGSTVFYSKTSRYSNWEFPYTPPKAIFDKSMIEIKTMSGSSYYITMPINLVDYALIELLGLVRNDT